MTPVHSVHLLHRQPSFIKRPSFQQRNAYLITVTRAFSLKIQGDQWLLWWENYPSASCFCSLWVDEKLRLVWMTFSHWTLYILCCYFTTVLYPAPCSKKKICIPPTQTSSTCRPASLYTNECDNRSHRSWEEQYCAVGRVVVSVFALWSRK